MNQQGVLLSVDIGTTSVRSAFFTLKGELLSVSVIPITIFDFTVFEQRFYEQNSDEIWVAVKESSRKSWEDASRKAKNLIIVGVCIDATCSLVFANTDGKPICLNPSLQHSSNVIMWLDHRANDEHAEINSVKHSALSAYGGALSIEMEPPKLLWTKRNCSNWLKFDIIMDLADFMTYKITRTKHIRSLCTMTCKWAYCSHNSDFQESFWNSIGLSEVLTRFLNSSQILSPGMSILGDACEVLGNEFNLPCSRDLAVSAGLIDAYAGALGCLATDITFDSETVIQPTEMAALICGTSTCLLIFVEGTAEVVPPSVPGVWGPFWNVLGNNCWIYEAGQSAAGKLLDWVFEFHSQGVKFRNPGDRELTLTNHLQQMSIHKKLNDINFLTKDIHVCPDFHGNRSPLARPDYKGMIVGLDLDSSIDSLALLYLAAVQSLAYNIRFIMESFESCGIKLPKVMVACGGLSQDTLYLKIHADVLQIPFAVSSCSEVVLLGNAIVGAVATGAYPNLFESVQQMSSPCKCLHQPTDKRDLHEYHDKKYKVYRKLLENQDSYLSIMSS